MSPPRFYEATVLLPAGAEPRWRAREISYDDMTVTVAEGIARLFTLESGTSLDGFTVERDGDTLLFRLLVDTKIPWERILEAILHAAVLEGGLAEMIGGDRWAEPGDVSTHAFDGNGRCEGVVVDDIDAWVARCDTFRAIIAQQQRRMLPWIDKHANLTIDAAVAIAFEYPCGPERDRALEVLGDATDPAGVATLLRAFDQQDLPPWPLAAYGGKAAARQRDDELRQLRADAGRVLAKTTDRTTPRALLAILERERARLADSTADGWNMDIDRFDAVIRLLGDRKTAGLEDDWIALWHSHPSVTIRRAAAHALFASGTQRSLDTLGKRPWGDDSDHECARAFVRLDRATVFDRAAPYFRPEMLDSEDTFALLWGIDVEDFGGTAPARRVLEDPRWIPLLTSLADHRRLGWHATSLLAQLRRVSSAR